MMPWNADVMLTVWQVTGQRGVQDVTKTDFPLPSRSQSGPELIFPNSEGFAYQVCRDDHGNDCRFGC